MIGKNKLGVLIGPQFDDALGFVDDIAIAGLLSHHVRTRREHGEVDLSVLVRSELLGAVGALHRFDFKNGVGNRL